MFSKVVVSSLLLAASVNGVMGIQYKREPGWFQRDLQGQEIIRDVIDLRDHVVDPNHQQVVPSLSSQLSGPLPTPVDGTSQPGSTRSQKRTSSKSKRMVRMKRQLNSRDDGDVDPNAVASSSVDGSSSSASATPSDSGSATPSDSSIPTPTDSGSATPTDPSAATPSASVSGASVDPSAATPDPNAASSSAAPSSTPLSSDALSSSGVVPSASIASGSGSAASVSPTAPPDALDQLIGSLFNGLPQGVLDGLSALAAAQMSSTAAGVQAAPSGSASVSDGSSAASSATPTPGADSTTLPSASDSGSASVPSATPSDGSSSALPSSSDSASAVPSATDSPSASSSDSAAVPSSTDPASPDASATTDDPDSVVGRRRAYPPLIRRSVAPSGSISPSVNAGSSRKFVFSPSTLTGLGAVAASMLLGALIAV